MSNKNLYAAVALLIFSLTGCATPVTSSPQASREEIAEESRLQKTMLFKDVIKSGDKLYNLSFPILASNAELCGAKVAPSIGMTVWNIDSIEWGYHTVAREIYGLHSGLTVSYIADSSPAARAGIHSGDLIMAVNGKPIPEGKEAIKLVKDEVKNSEYNKIRFDLERKGKIFVANVKPAPVCDYSVIYDPKSTELNAWADGQNIFITKPIIKFTENDSELALIVSHELAHNVMSHIDKKVTNSMVGGLGGLAVDAILAGVGVSTGNQFSSLGQSLGVNAYSVEFEQEADYVGMYFMERARYSSKNVADFWRRLALESPENITKRYTHPTSPERYLAINRTYEEIKNKRARGLSLTPDRNH